MKLDKNALKGLLSLNDQQLYAILTQLAGSNGINLQNNNFSINDIANLRKALETASEGDIPNYIQYLSKYKKQPNEQQ